MVTYLQNEDVTDEKHVVNEKRFDKSAFLRDPYAAEFAEVRHALLAHLRLKQEAMGSAPVISSASTSPLPKSDLQKAVALSPHAPVAPEGEVFPATSLPALADKPGSHLIDTKIGVLGETDGKVRTRILSYARISRMLDVIGGVMLLVPTLPIMFLTAAVVKSTSPGPIFSTMRRLGCDEHPFLLYRFRTTEMALDPEGAYSTHLDDVAITPLGSCLRSSKLQRLPEILNVIKGDMSLVGPRARHPWFAQFMTAEQRQNIFSVRPGIVGPVQLRFRYERRLLACQTDRLGYFLRVLLPLQLRAEEEYLRQRDLRHDLALLARTWRVTRRNFGARNQQILKDWLQQGGQTEGLVGHSLPTDDAVRNFYPQNSADMYTRQWECFASSSQPLQQR